MDVGDTQTKLSQWAAQDRTHRFYDLYHLLYHDDWLRTAQAHVKQNAGSQTAGGDGMDMRAFEEQLEDNLTRLGEDLKTGRFAPQPVRRTYIREVKAGGRIKRRPLGIPTVCAYCTSFNRCSGGPGHQGRCECGGYVGAAPPARWASPHATRAHQGSLDSPE